jgi:hypothetical protein
VAQVPLIDVGHSNANSVGGITCRTHPEHPPGSPEAEALRLQFEKERAARLERDRPAFEAAMKKSAKAGQVPGDRATKVIVLLAVLFLALYLLL